MNSREAVAQVLRNIKTLPTLPDVAMRLLQTSDNEGASTRDMATLIERDPSLAARVLKLVNSPVFGLRREITSVQQALVLLGTRQLRSLVLSGAMFDLFDQEGGVGSFRRQDLWVHSVAVASVCRELASQSRSCDPELAFTAGLLHDIGKVILDRYLHEHFVKVIEYMDENDLVMREAEMEVLGIDHAQIGAHFTLYWNLPEVLREAVGSHHDPESAEASPALTSLVSLANALAREIGVGSGGGRSLPPDPADMQRIGLSEDAYRAVFDKMEERLADDVGQMIGK